MKSLLVLLSLLLLVACKAPVAPVPIGLVYDIDKVLARHTETLQAVQQGSRSPQDMQQLSRFIAEFGAVQGSWKDYSKASLLFSLFQAECSSSEADSIQCLLQIDRILGYILESR